MICEWWDGSYGEGEMGVLGVQEPGVVRLLGVRGSSGREKTIRAE